MPIERGVYDALSSLTVGCPEEPAVNECVDLAAVKLAIKQQSQPEVALRQ
jgi:hypothetical protein